MRKHRLGKLLLIVLCVSLLVFLAGCRPSPVLEQIIYEQNHQVDPDTETKTMNDDLENEEPDEDIPSRETVDDSEQEKDQEYTSALAGDEDTDSEDPYAVYDVTYSPSGDLSEPTETNPTEGSTSDTATGSTKAGGDEGGNTPSGEGEEPGNDGLSEGDSGGGTSAGDEQSGGGNGNGDDGAVSGEGLDPGDASTPMEDPDNGEPEELPTGSRVTAVGEAAAIVEMMGDSAQLVGTSSSFYENSLEQQVFASQGASEVPVWWDGDGSSPCRNFDALLEAHPDVCFVISGQNTFSEEQYAALDGAGIPYVLLQLNTIENIKTAVKRVGEVLGDDATRIASDYCNWADNTITWAKGSYGAKATTYIGDWDDQAYWQLTNDTTTFAGWGVPVSVANASSSPLNECMGYVNVTNTAMDGYYVEPIYQLTYEPIIEGTLKLRSWAHIIYSDDVGAGLGTAVYPAVIVADDSIRNNIYNAEGGNYYRYHWLQGSLWRTDSGTWAYGIDDGLGGFIATRIQNEQEYQILVNPSGVGNWANGSVESPLEAAWLACEFQGRDMNELRSMVAEFYNTFYNGYQVDTAAVLKE